MQSPSKSTNALELGIERRSEAVGVLQLGSFVTTKVWKKFLVMYFPSCWLLPIATLIPSEGD